jgi:hypothetical protein
MSIRPRFRPRSCLVCTQPTLNEGQLCTECANAGHRVDDDTVYVYLSFEMP